MAGSTAASSVGAVPAMLAQGLCLLESLPVRSDNDLVPGVAHAIQEPAAPSPSVVVASVAIAVKELDHRAGRVRVALEK